VSVFTGYAHYYDLLYRDKDYLSETAFVFDLIQKFSPGAHTILELGCGTGGHALHLAKRGLVVHGVDMSLRMLEEAKKKVEMLPPGMGNNLSFSHGDVCNTRIEKRFDCTISLFHVVSYQTRNEDVAATFQTAKHHLNPGGIFIFDCWYGPAVLTTWPEVRVKRFEDDLYRIIRIAEPVMHPNENLVDVNYTVLITDKQKTTVEELKETHRMRYFFYPEIDMLCAQNGFEMVSAQEWMTGNMPGFNTWGVCFVVRV
jgi:SAM-dependent methyltransferase